MTIESLPVEMIAPCPLDDQPIEKLPAPLSPQTELPPEFPEECTTFLPCLVCNRTFSPTALERHSKVCQKLSTKKRHIFDSTKQRSDHLDIHIPKTAKESAKDAAAKKSRWREKRAEFLRAIRAAKGNTDEEESSEGGRRPSVPSDYIKCTHCERYFGPKAAERHINWCSEQKNRLPRSHTSEDAEAIQRLKTRTKYVPPKPGQNGWRAPKKKDVISSIPPPNVGANVTPPGRLISPPPPSHRHASPPPLPSSRKGSLPPGPPRYNTGSLGRHAGRQFSAMLQSVTGYSGGYGTSSGYGSSALYGSPSTGNPSSPFNRSSSLRLPRRRQVGGQRMARSRDLASDMMASVSIGGKAKRGEPEGDEADSSFYDHSPDSYYDNNVHLNKLDDAPYDPFSAAELQFQALFGPSKDTLYKPGGRRSFGGSGLMGSTGSLKTVGIRRKSSHDYPSNPLRNRSSSISGGYLSLCSMGLDNGDDLKSLGGDSSDMDHSPKELLSPEEEFENMLARFSPTRRSYASKDNSSRRSPTRNSSLKNSSNIRYSPTRTNSSTTTTISTISPRHSPSRVADSDHVESIFPRISPPRSDYGNKFSFKGNSPFRLSPSPEETRFGTSRYRASLSPPPMENPRGSGSAFTSDRKPGDGSNFLKKSPPSSLYLKPSESLTKERSPFLVQPPRTHLEYQSKQLDTTGSSSNHYGWMKPSESSSPNSYSRHFGLGKLSKESSPSESKKSSFSAVGDKERKDSFEDDPKLRRNFDRLDETHHRMSSSGSSTDSSLPPVSSPMNSTDQRDSGAAFAATRFCHECGHKYPVIIAKFCCHCGAKRVSVGP